MLCWFWSDCFNIYRINISCTRLTTSQFNQIGWFRVCHKVDVHRINRWDAICVRYVTKWSVFQNDYCGYIEYIVCMKPNWYNHITLQLRTYTKMSCVKRDVWFLSIKNEIMLIKIISFNLTLNLLAQYDMMKTTIVKHLSYSYNLFTRVFKTHSLYSLIFNYTEYFILIYTVTYLTLCR